MSANALALTILDCQNAVKQYLQRVMLLLFMHIYANISKYNTKLNIMTAEQSFTPETNLPSGYQSVEQLSEPSRLTPDQLPWLDGPTEISTVRCTLQGGETFLFASAVGTHPDLVAAANKMTSQQDKNTNNMLYSRLAGFVSNGYTSPQVSSCDTMPIPSFVLRNNGGQRVYFSMITSANSTDRLFIKLAACDKNNQQKVINVINTTTGAREKRALKAKGGQ